MLGLKMLQLGHCKNNLLFCSFIFLFLVFLYFLQSISSPNQSHTAVYIHYLSTRSLIVLL